MSEDYDLPSRGNQQTNVIKLHDNVGTNDMLYGHTLLGLGSR
jgi:hypothetical protein